MKVNQSLIFIILILILGLSLNCKKEPHDTIENALEIERDYKLKVDIVLNTDGYFDVLIIHGNYAVNDYSLKRDRIQHKLLISFKGFHWQEKETLSLFDGNINLETRNTTYNGNKIAEIEIQCHTNLPVIIDQVYSGIRLKNINLPSSLSLDYPNLRENIKSGFTADLHNDSIYHIWARYKDFYNYPDLQINIEKLLETSFDLITMAIWIPDYFSQYKQTHPFVFTEFAYFDHYLNKPDQLTFHILEKIHGILLEYPQDLKLILEPEDIIECRQNHLTGIMISIEGAHALNNDLDNLKQMVEQGLRNVGLCWNNSNEYADGVGMNRPLYNGLSQAGEELINTLVNNRLLIDISHSSDQTFEDVMRVLPEDYPLIATHSNVRSICSHKRNLTDQQIQEIHRREGIIGINFHSGFINGRRSASLDEILDHVDYIVQLASVDTVALGSDFDGFIHAPENLEDITQVDNLAVGLFNRGYTENEIKKIMGENVIRVFKAVRGYHQR